MQRRSGMTVAAFLFDWLLCKILSLVNPAPDIVDGIMDETSSPH